MSYCACCGKRYDTKAMCPECRRSRNQTLIECAKIARKADVEHLHDPREAIAELILELVRGE